MHRETAIKFYRYFYEKSTSSDMPSMAQRDKSMVDSFLSSSSISTESELFTYMSYQFAYWRRLDTKFGRGRVMPNWVFGKKAVQRYEEASDGDRSSAYAELRSVIFVDRDYLVKQKIYIPEKEGLSESEEFTKSVRHNTDEGYILCLDYTSLYRADSSWCAKCDYAGQCEQMKEELGVC